jgi:hypothetical protein
MKQCVERIASVPLRFYNPFDLANGAAKTCVGT